MILSATTALILTGASLADIWAVAIGVLGFIVALGLAVFIHELGHFLAAKAFRVPVDRFVIGFDKDAIGALPRCIWEKKLGETTYGLSLIPLGGYVKMKGMVHPDIEKYLDCEEEKGKDAGEKADTSAHPTTLSDQFTVAPKARTASLQEQALGDMAALYRKPYWQKVIVYAAGVFMNMVLATFVMGMLFAVGFWESAPYPAKIGWMAPGNQFLETPIKSGDSVVAVNGAAVETTADFWTEVEKAAGGKELGKDIQSLSVALTVEPAGMEGVTESRFDYELTITTDQKFQVDFSQAFFRRDAYMDFILPNTPAERAGIQRGDVVVRVDQEPIDDWAEFSYIVSQSPEKLLKVEVTRDDELVVLDVTPWKNADDPTLGQIGVLVGNSHKVFVQKPVLEAFAQAPELVYLQTVNYVSKLGNLGGKLAKGNVTAVSREVGGPVGIAQIAYKMAQNGFSDWLKFLIMLNVALAVMNILPFPILDGGHIVFATYEAVFRRPVPARILIPLLNGALVFLLVFFVLVTFNDVRKFFF